MSGAGQRGDAWNVVRYVRASRRGPLRGRASSPERAHRLAARYRAMGGEHGAVVEVSSATGHRWNPWVWNDALGRWQRALASATPDEFGKIPRSLRANTRGNQ